MRGRPQTQERWLLVAFVLVVALFALATVVSQTLSRNIDSASQAITDNAGPSIVFLSRARSSLALEQLQLDDYLDAVAEGLTPDMGDIEGPWRRMRESIRAYQSITPLPGEPPLAAPLDGDLAKVADLRAQVLALSGQGRHLEAVRLEKQALDAAMHTARERLDLLIAYDANQAAQLGERIHAWHRRSGQVALGLDALVALLTIGVAVLALRKLGRARDRLERENRQLEARGLELEEFSGRMAHDVLSPLFTAGIGWELARKLYPDDERLARLAETGRAAIQRSRRLVEDLLAFSLAGNKGGAGGTAELGLVVADVVANLEAEAGAAGVQLVAEPGPAAHIACSAGVLTSILLNLVRNAIKHMDGATVRRIEIRHRLQSERLHCEITDTGPGIAFEDQRAIFEPYVRGTTKAAGIGLGLATVKRLVEGHGGSVGVRSAPGHGATFWFELPLVASEQEQPLLQ